MMSKWACWSAQLWSADCLRHHSLLGPMDLEQREGREGRGFWEPFTYLQSSLLLHSSSQAWAAARPFFWHWALRPYFLPYTHANLGSHFHPTIQFLYRTQQRNTPNMNHRVLNDPRGELVIWSSFSLSPAPRPSLRLLFSRSYTMVFPFNISCHFCDKDHLSFRFSNMKSGDSKNAFRFLRELEWILCPDLKKSALGCLRTSKTLILDLIPIWCNIVSRLLTVFFYFQVYARYSSDISYRSIMPGVLVSEQFYKVSSQFTLVWAPNLDL